MKRTQPKRVLKLARKRKEILFSFGPGLRATKVRPVCCYFFCLLINYLAIFLQCGVAPVEIDTPVHETLHYC